MVKNPDPVPSLYQTKDNHTMTAMHYFNAVLLIHAKQTTQDIGAENTNTAVHRKLLKTATAGFLVKL